jgi:hypothetical protein
MKCNKTETRAAIKDFGSQTLQHESQIMTEFCKLVLHGMNAGEIDPKLVESSIEAWFHLSGYICSENNKFSMLIHKVP